MALPKYDGNTNYVRQLDDHVKGGADVVKYAMDRFGEEFKDWFNNTYLPALLSTEHNNSGADNIGTTPILEGADTVQKALSALLTQIQATAIGQIPDGAITDAKLSNAEGQIKDRVTEIQGEVESHKAENTQQHNDINNEIVEIKKKIGIVHNIESWAEVQAIVRAGIADQVFSIGDMLVSKYKGKEEIWIVIGINHDTPTDSSMTYSMTIQTLDCLHNVQFDAPEPTNPDADRKSDGNNRYLHSAVRQWLNSNEDVFQWASQHEYDAAPAGSTYEGAGFLKLLDPELSAVIGAVDKQVARNTATDGGGQDVFSDKVFLLSRVEIYGGTEGDTTGEEPYPYYSALAGSPTTGDLAGRIKLLNGSPRYWWLRSPRVPDSHFARCVGTTGYVDSSFARISNGLSPACCII